MRRRSLLRNLLFGAIVAVLVIAAVPVVYVTFRDGVAAVRVGEPQEAIVNWAISLVATVIPVAAIAAYAHWLYVTSRPREPHEEHIPTRAEDVLFGIGTGAVAIAAWPVGKYAYQESVAAFGDGSLTFALLYGLLGVTYLAFTAFCVTRYVQWLR